MLVFGEELGRHGKVMRRLWAGTYGNLVNKISRGKRGKKSKKRMVRKLKNHRSTLLA